MTVWIYLGRGLLLALALSLAWVSLVNGLGNEYIDLIRQGDKDAVEPALDWRPNHPEVLLAGALALMRHDQAASVRMLERAYRANPADSRPLATLAGLSLLEHLHLTQGDEMADDASRLAPSDAANQSALAVYWRARGEYDRMIAHWSSALEASRSKRVKIYPQLLSIAGDPGSRALLQPLASSPPNWWTDFFQHAARNAPDLETVRFLYALRRHSAGEPVTAEERAAFVARLLKDGAISDAYVLWISGLDAEARRHLGLLFDGGFDLPIDGSGFGWRVGSSKHYSAGAEPTAGASGGAALKVHFRAFEGVFGQVWQPLSLEPGLYRLSGRVKADALISKGGLRWDVRCLRPTQEVLGEGPRFLGSSDWSSFDVSFEVPQDCDYQKVVLTSAGTYGFERKFDGDIWFDDMRIARAATLDAAARADKILRTGEEPH